MAPGSAGRRVGNADSEDSRADCQTFPERMRSPAVGYVVYEYEAVGVMLILEKKG